MKNQLKKEKILKEILALTPMVRGKVCKIKSSAKGHEYYSRQVWFEGRNRTKYISPENVEKTRLATKNYKKAKELFEKFVSLAEEESGL